MSEDLSTKIHKWLKMNGYPLEMKVASAFRANDFFVTQGTYYSDPETGTSREIDVIATKGDDIGFFELVVVVECKRSPDKPWILFTSEKHEEGRNKFFTFGILSEMARKKLVERIFKFDNHDRINLPWFDKPQRTAYGIATSFGSGEDSAYKAVTGVLKAGLYLNRQDESFCQPLLRFIFPVVVLDGKLFDAYLDEAGETVVNEIEEGFLTNSRTIAGEFCPSIRVITSEYLAKICAEALELSNKLQFLLKPDLDKMLEDLAQRR